MDSQREQVIRELALNRALAHKTLFAHRHHNQTPQFHYEIMRAWSGVSERVLIKAFRGAAKSTLAEEAIVLGAVYQEFHNCIILGETYHRAVERLSAIKNELENNQFLGQLFGNLCGEPWTENKIVLTNGVIIQAFGRGQSLRGSKHHDRRPDLAFADDIENEESCIDEGAIAKTMRWIMSVVLPAMDPNYRIRINGTPLHPKSVIMQLAKDADWKTYTYPIESIGLDGERIPAWPDRFPIDFIDRERGRFERVGMATEYAQEYMCEAEDISQKPFTPDLIRHEPRIRTWEATYAFFDPAKSVGPRSDMTGWAVWSWINNRLIVWDGGAGLWKPDELISQIFVIDETFRPVEIGVEKTGLVEFLLQPLRQEMIKRGYSIPLRDYQAPRGKMDFIRSLQPFFKAREVEFAKDCPELVAQLLSFPSGKIDGPNALAYALAMRPGAPVFEGFSFPNIADELHLAPRTDTYLAINSDRRHTAAVLIQSVGGAVHVLWDGVREGDPGGVLPALVADARLFAKRPCSFIAGPQHFRDHDTIGLRAAARAIPINLSLGGAETQGREQVRSLLSKNVRGFPAFRVASTATWTLRALSGGYCIEYNKHGAINDFIRPGPYATVMSALESWAALLGSAAMGESEDGRNYAYTPEGRRYLSSLVP